MGYLRIAKYHQLSNKYSDRVDPVEPMEAVLLTMDNIPEIIVWCGGTVVTRNDKMLLALSTWDARGGVHNRTQVPVNGTRWIVKHEEGFDVFLDVTFRGWFKKVEEETETRLDDAVRARKLHHLLKSTMDMGLISDVWPDKGQIREEYLADIVKKIEKLFR